MARVQSGTNLVVTSRALVVELSVRKKKHLYFIYISIGGVVMGEVNNR